jgi:hypothetical protein
MEKRYIEASDLRVGDTIKVWWRPGRDTVTKLVPYDGPLDLGPNPQIALFAICKSGMTITHVDVFELISRVEGVNNKAGERLV